MSPAHPSLARAAAAALGAAVVLMLLAVPAGAHATLRASSPAEGESVEGGPERIALTFTEEMTQPATVSVTGPDGRALVDEEPEIDGEQVVLALDELAGDGTYEVQWRAVSADGHPVEGRFTFEATGTEEAPAPDREEDAPATGATEPAPTEAEVSGSAPKPTPAGADEGSQVPAAAAGETEDGASSAMSTPTVGIVALLVLLAGGGALLARRRQARVQPTPDRHA